MRLYTRILLAGSLLYLIVLLTLQWHVITKPFDASYWKDRYDHSQWSMPVSKRIIGDDGLYLWAGYDLTHGGSILHVNPEVPPLGKYLIGIVTALTDRGALFGVLSTGTLLLATTLLSTSLFSSRFIATAVITLLLTDPLITQQWKLTMLDSIQAALACLSLWILLRNKGASIQKYTAAGAGFLLGLCSATKVPVFTPMLLLAGIIWIVRQRGSLATVTLYLLGTAGGYAIVFLPFLLSGHNIEEIITLQRWMVSFYRHSGVQPTLGSVLTTLVAGKQQLTTSRLWETVSQWSPLWSILPFATLFSLFIGVKRTSFPVIWIGALSLSLLCFTSLIPFWTRYLVFILPFLYLSLGTILERLPQRIVPFLVFGAVAINSVASIPMLFPTPNDTATQIVYTLTHQFYRDLYEHLSQESKQQISPEAFHMTGLVAMSQAEVESIEIQSSHAPWNSWESPQLLNLNITFHTRNLGPFTQTTTLPLLKEQGQWFALWSWDTLLSGFVPGDSIKTTVDRAKRGPILASDKKPIAEDYTTALITVIPGAITPSRETALFSFLETLFEKRLPAVVIHQRVYGNSLPFLPVPIGIPPRPLTTEQKQILTSFPEIRLEPAFGRINYGSAVVSVGSVGNTDYSECCSLLYSTTTYDGINGVEKTKNSILKGRNGGSIQLLSHDGEIKRTILSVEKQEGQSTQP